jgi:ankyrin repeat protein
LNGHDKIVELLINKGIDVNIKDKLFGQTALHIGLYKIKLKY